MTVPMLTLDQLVKAATIFAETKLIGKEGAQIVPMFHVQFKDRPPAIMAAPWTNDAEKNIFIVAFKRSLKEFRDDVVSYSFISEAWSANEDPKHPTGLMPREREDRKEIVMINASDGKDSRIRILEISRDAKGLVDKLVEEPTPMDALQRRPLQSPKRRGLNPMKITQLEWRGTHRIEVSENEMSALKKVINAGLLLLEGEDEDGLWADFTSGERKAMAYWAGNPFSEEGEKKREQFSKAHKDAHKRSRAALKPAKVE